MKLWFGIVVALLAVLVGANLAGSGQAQAQIVRCDGSVGGLTRSGACPPAAAACTPACPGDVVSGASLAWMVARCYSAAYVGNHLDIGSSARLAVSSLPSSAPRPARSSPGMLVPRSPPHVGRRDRRSRARSRLSTMSPAPIYALARNARPPQRMGRERSTRTMQ
jgi:hypothetical protein